MASEGARSTGCVSRRRFLSATAAAGTAAVAGCQVNPYAQEGDGPGTGDDGNPGTGSGNGDGVLSGDIKIAGSSTVFPLASQMKEEFEQAYPGADVGFGIQSTGSGGGFTNHFCPGRTDFNNASRPIKEEEIEQCAESGVEPVELKVATDALTVVVNSEAEWIDCITVEELAEVWSAEAQPERWSDVNDDWPDEEVNLFGPTEASGTYDYFIEAILGEEGPGHRQDYQATEQDRTIINGVDRNDYAMGYMGFAYYTENRDAVKALGVDDGDGCVKPSLETAKSGEYTPLSRPLFTYVKQSSLAKDHVREFAEFWLENATSTELVADEVGYVPLDEDEQALQLGRIHQAANEATSGAS